MGATGQYPENAKIFGVTFIYPSQIWRHNANYVLRVKKIKNLPSKACLHVPSLLCYLMCPGYFGGDFRIFGFCPLEKLDRILKLKIKKK